MNNKKPSRIVPPFNIVEPVNINDEDEDESEFQIPVRPNAAANPVITTLSGPQVSQKDEKTQKDEPETSRKRHKFQHSITTSQSDKEIEGKSLQKLIEIHKSFESGLDNGSRDSESSTSPHVITSGENVTTSTSDQYESDSLKIPRLKKMMCLSEDRSGEIDSSTTTLSSDEGNQDCNTESTKDRLLATIVRLDKECNLFGLSNFSMEKTKHPKKKKTNAKPVFPQTTIVQVCCSTACCANKSWTDLPSSLKSRPGPGICCGPACTKSCRPTCAAGCTLFGPPPKCGRSCGVCVGLTIMERKRTKYEPPPITLSPRSSCIMALPLMARECTHTPRCCPPSPGCPYLMPCYWPSRRGAPCTEPSRCFHNPPCLPRRKPRVTITNPDLACPKGRPCKTSDDECENILCLGQNKEFKSEFEKKYGGNGGGKSKKKGEERKSSVASPTPSNDSKGKEKDKGKGNDKDKEKAKGKGKEALKDKGGLKKQDSGSSKKSGSKSNSPRGSVTKGASPTALHKK